MDKDRVYIGLGGNIGNTEEVFNQVLGHLKQSAHIHHLVCSHYYTTTPVGGIPQENYLNAVCAFQTTFTPLELRDFLVSIEKSFGKEKKIKDGPRIIDLDILFFYQAAFDHPDLVVPHPRWKERLFVLKPLRELTRTISVGQEVIDLDTLLHRFTNPHNERVTQK